MPPSASNIHAFPTRLRVRSRADFAAVFENGIRETRGPLALCARPNSLAHPRLGLAVPRRVGTAVRRNHIKRLLRESFRLLQHDLPRGYDMIVLVRPHEPLALADYQRLLSGLASRIHERWEKRPAGKPGPAEA